MERSEVITLVLINTVAWGIIHMGFAWAGTRMPASLFRPGWWLFRTRRFEKGGGFYERWFCIKRWKDHLPDAAPWFKGGFPKARLSQTDASYIQAFIVETCRGEAVHETVILASFLFFLFNPWRVAIIMVIYGICSNLPCILTQRYNRIRLERLQVVRQRTRMHNRGDG